jgi:hypothetical protein
LTANDETTETTPGARIPDDRAAASIGMTTVGLRYECRVNRRVRSVGQELGRLLFADEELRRFKKETLPMIRAEQKRRIRAGALNGLPDVKRLRQSRRYSDDEG